MLLTPFLFLPIRKCCRVDQCIISSRWSIRFIIDLLFHLLSCRLIALSVHSIWNEFDVIMSDGPLHRCAILGVAHAPGMPGLFSPTPISKETPFCRSRHASRHVRHAHAMMHVGIANLRCRGKRSWHSRRMRNPQYCVSGKRPMDRILHHIR